MGVGHLIKGSIDLTKNSANTVELVIQIIEAEIITIIA
jgi:hypothetical protein